MTWEPKNKTITSGTWAEATDTNFRKDQIKTFKYQHMP